MPAEWFVCGMLRMWEEWKCQGIEGCLKETRNTWLITNPPIDNKMIISGFQMRSFCTCPTAKSHSYCHLQTMVKTSHTIEKNLFTEYANGSRNVSVTPRSSFSCFFLNLRIRHLAGRRSKLWRYKKTRGILFLTEYFSPPESPGQEQIIIRKKKTVWVSPCKFLGRIGKEFPFPPRFCVTHIMQYLFHFPPVCQ